MAVAAKKNPKHERGLDFRRREGETSSSREIDLVGWRPNWRRFVHTLCLCELSIGYQGPFRLLCLRPQKFRFPATETGVSARRLSGGVFSHCTVS
jgi:hypothetical protein